MALRPPCLAAAWLVAAIAPSPAPAHFQLLYTPEVNRARPGEVPFKLLFWHPFENGQVMNMGKPQAFYYVHKDQKTDLMGRLRPITFQGALNAAAAYDAAVRLNRTGDYIFVLVPEPYYEPGEDIYIQQITKSYVNRSAIPGNWMDPVGLATEIAPLNKPTNVLAGSTFTGRVYAGGSPIGGARVEIEFMAAEPDMTHNTPKTPTASPMAGGTMVAIADENGYFTFGIPRAGFWGFAALDVGPAKMYQGKKLSQDAVLWIRAFDLD